MATKKTTTTKRTTVKKAETTEEKARKKPPRFFPLGVSGVKRKGGEVDDEWLSDLRGSKAAKVYREMADNDPIVGAFLWVVELLTRQTGYSIEPANDTPEAQAVADFCQSCIDDMTGGLEGFMSEFLTALQYGWAWMEKTYKIRRGPEYRTPQLHSKYDDGRIGICRIGLIGQETLHEWVWDEDGRAIAMVQQPPPPFGGLRVIPREKALHVRLRSRLDNPEGYSVLRTAYTTYYYKKNFQFVEAVGIERDLAGYPVMEVPPELLESDDSQDTAVIDSYKDLVRKIKRDEYEGVVIPSETMSDGTVSGFKLRLLTSGGKRPADVDPVIRRLDSRMAMTMLAEFLVVGLDKVGSLSLHSDKTALFTTSLGAILDERDRQFTEEVFPELLRLNGTPVELSPALVHHDVEKVDLGALGGFLQAVTGSGVVTIDDRLEEWTRERSGLPKPDLASSRANATAGQLALPMETEL